MKTSGVRVLQNIPGTSRDTDSECFPKELIGATIVEIGEAENAHIIGEGRLVIDFQPVGSCDVRRIILGFSERDMCVRYLGLRR